MSQFFQYKFFIAVSAAVNYVCIFERRDIFQRWREEERTREDRPFTIDIAGKLDIHMQNYEIGYLYLTLLTKITQRVLRT